MRKIEELMELDGRVFIYLATKELQKQFMKQAEEEGFTFGGYILPTKNPLSPVLAINKNRTLNYVGVNGIFGFKHPQIVKYCTLIRVDYEQFINDEEEYIIPLSRDFGGVLHCSWTIG